MDQRSDLTTEGTGGGCVSVDQAIFTSVRSPMGEGYRLIASSSGLSVDEKREITQRSPSHDGLCESSPEATGLAGYPLSSGRHCVAMSRHAGLEQSGRGGQRVYTHIVVLARGGFRRFGCDPFDVCAALRAAVGDELVLQSGIRLDALPLVVPGDEACGLDRQGVVPGAALDAERAANLLGLVLEGRHVVVAGAAAPAATLQRIVRAVPRCVRETLATSHGLKLTPSRVFPLTFVQAGRGEAARVLRGRDAVQYDWESPPPRSASPFDAWIGFVRARWAEARFSELDRLADRLTEDASAELLQRVVQLSRDLEGARLAGEETLGDLAAKYAPVSWGGGVCGELMQELQRVVAKRQQHFAEQRACVAPE